jgi:hypothetical protein
MRQYEPAAGRDLSGSWLAALAVASVLLCCRLITGAMKLSIDRTIGATRERTRYAEDALRATEPRRWLFGDLAVIAFLLAQVLDGVFTYLGILTFGPAVEANPLIAQCVVSLGIGVALVGAKALAIACVFPLHLRAMHLTVAFFTVVYFGTAVLPWTRILWP